MFCYRSCFVHASSLHCPTDLNAVTTYTPPLCYDYILYAFLALTHFNVQVTCLCRKSVHTQEIQRQYLTENEIVCGKQLSALNTQKLNKDL